MFARENDGRFFGSSAGDGEVKPQTVERIIQTVGVIAILALAVLVEYGVGTDCPDTAGVYVKCGDGE